MYSFNTLPQRRLCLKMFFIFALCYVYNYTSRKVYVYGFAFVVFGMLIVLCAFLA